MNFTEMKNFMDRLVQWRVPGNSISICLNNEEVFNYQSGFCDYENKVPMSKDGLFNIYSCSKVATVTAAMQLYEKGYFLLDDPLYEFIPEYKRMYIKTDEGEIKEAQNHITLRNLFTMTSGLSYDFKTEAFKRAREVTNGNMDTLSVIRCLASDPLSFEPGEKWQYGLSHDVLAAVVEIVSGKRFCEYVKENIFKPLGMNNSYYHNEEVIDRVMYQYQYRALQQEDMIKHQSDNKFTNNGYIENIGKKVVDHIHGPGYDSGGAGITTSVEDYSIFASALANGGIGKTGERILSPNTIELMRTNQLDEDLMKTFSWPQFKGYGYGLGVRTLISKAKSGSNGSCGEFGWGGLSGGTVLVDPDLKLSVFYTHHMLPPHEAYYQPRLRNVLYNCISS